MLARLDARRAERHGPRPEGPRGDRTLSLAAARLLVAYDGELDSGAHEAHGEPGGKDVDQDAPDEREACHGALAGADEGWP